MTRSCFLVFYIYLDFITYFSYFTQLLFKTTIAKSKSCQKKKNYENTMFISLKLLNVNIKVLIKLFVYFINTLYFISLVSSFY